mgnify:FL=1
MNDIKLGKKICIFFIHGFCSGSEDWDKQIEYFKSRFTVIAPILRGHDGKNKFDLPMSIEQITNDCKKLIDDHREKYFIFVGHSMGTRVAINLSYQFKIRTLGLILVDGSRFSNIERYGKVITDFENTISKKDYNLILKKMFESMFFDEKFKNDKKRIVERAVKIPKKYSLPLRRNVIWFDAHCLENLLKKINAPILILHSTKLDKKRNRKPIQNNEKIDYVEFVKSLSSKVEVKVFKNTGHYISIEKPKLVNKTISEWFKKIKI